MVHDLKKSFHVENINTDFYYYLLISSGDLKKFKLLIKTSPGLNFKQ